MNLISRALAVILAVCVAPCARADDVADFYRGKTITIFIGYEPGGAYDLYARTIGRYFSKHMPGNPQILAVNMPGASSMVLGNHLARIAPKDGTVIGAVNAALIFDPLFNGANSRAQFKGPDLPAIGNAVSAAAVLFSWKTSPVKTFEDLKKHDLVIGAMTKTGDTYIMPAAVKKILGLDRLKIITGYPGTREALLALERGEIMGRVWDMEGIRSVRPQWLEEGSINILAQLAPERMPEVPANVPMVKDFVSDPDDRRALDVIFLSTLLARPYLAPPGTPPDRLAALRKAFMATLADPDFRAEMQKAQAGVQPMSGEIMEQHVRDAYALPDALIQKIRNIVAD
jgi:tripartite-type tricarboxylate transporter receptor subunit TctC